jgi:hypothetical protein
VLIEVDVWVRGTLNAQTHHISGLSSDAHNWDDGDVRLLLLEMLRALEREKNPGGERPSVTLHGFSWIVSPYESGGVVVHLEMQMGTASAGPLAIEVDRLTEIIERVMTKPASAPTVH